jgi:hypothetical protein
MSDLPLWKVFNLLDFCQESDVNVDDWSDDMKNTTFEHWFKSIPNKLLESTNKDSKTKLYQLNLFNESIILKTNPDKESLIREYEIGREINKITNRLPYFLSTLALFDQGDTRYLATKYVSGKLLFEVLQDPKTEFEDFINIFFQILLILESAQFFLEGFAHHDLHPKNVILKERQRGTAFSLYDSEYLLTYSMEPMIIDFGHASTDRVSIIGMETRRIFSQPTSGYDAYTFVLFCIKDSHEQLKKKILEFHQELFKNFTTRKRLHNQYDINLYVGTERIPPIKLADTLRRKYKQSIRMRRSERKSANIAFFFIQPSFFKEWNYVDSKHFLINVFRRQIWKKICPKEKLALPELTKKQIEEGISEDRAVFFDPTNQKHRKATLIQQLVDSELYYIIKDIPLADLDPYSTFLKSNPQFPQDIVDAILRLHSVPENRREYTDCNKYRDGILSR